jgi:YggT family protein
VIFNLLALVCFLYLLTLFGRVIFSWVQVFSRDWRPRGVLLVVAEVVFSLTDPPLRFLRRYIPPLTIGQIRLDVGMLILFFGVSFLLQLLLVLGAR